MRISRDYLGRIFAGLFIVLIGVLFLFANLDKLDIGYVFSTFWPLILIFIGLWHLVAHEFRRSGFGLVLIAVGVFFLLDSLDVIRGGVWRYFWPLLIIVIGLWIVFNPRFRPIRAKTPEHTEKDLDVSAVFSAVKRQIVSQEFKGGRASALMGAVELDFSQASLAENKATLELSATLGAIELMAPKEWEVVVDCSSILGAVEDKHKTDQTAENRPTLTIIGSAMLGSIEIK
jgi:predicted membrane protein